MGGFPTWLHVLAIASLALGVLCALVIATDEVRRPQSMWIMNLVWPLCALFGSLLWLAFYAWAGRAPPRGAHSGGMEDGASMAVAVAKGSSHCGAGCTLGDMLGEGLAVVAPSVAVAFGWGWLFADRMFAVWGLDFVVAFGLGVAFQYFTIAPMRDLSLREGIVAALKADAASIAAWQVGMYGAMAAIQFLVFRPRFGATAASTQPEFWFAMQGAMLCGFATSYPVNWLLVARGVKEKM